MPWHTVGGKHYGVPYQWGPNVLAYNTEVFKGQAPDSWKVVFEEMALPLLEEIAAEVLRRWPITAIAVVHRLGRLAIGEASVAVAVTSPHRGDAFAACRYAIDTLKATVPIWKKEFYADGAIWLDEPR